MIVNINKLTARRAPIKFNHFNTDGEIYFGSVNDLCHLIGGRLTKETKGEAGEIVFEFYWNIKAEKASLYAEVNMTYSINNSLVVPTFEELFYIAERANIQATEFLNHNLFMKKLQIAPRLIKELDEDDKRVIRGILLRDAP